MRHERGTLLVMLAALLVLCPRAWAQQNVPDALLGVTVQQKNNGTLNPALHVQELSCWRGKCSLTSVTLNDCRRSPVSSGKASPLIIERASTSEGNLTVTREGNTLVVVSAGIDIGGSYVTTQRFKYYDPRDGRMVRLLTGYSGGFVKNSTAVQQVLAVEFVPCRGSFREVGLDCPLGLPGVVLDLE